MESITNNALKIYKCIKSNVKVSFINIILKTKWYNHKDNHSILVQIGCVRSSQKDTSFTDEEVSKILKSIEMEIASMVMKAEPVKEVVDNKTSKKFQVLEITLNPIEV